VAQSDSARVRPGSRAAVLSLLLGLLSPLLAGAGVYLATEAMASPFVAFRTFALALPLGLAGMLIGWIGLLRARGERNPPAKRMALAGSLLSTLTVAAIVGLALPSASFPVINDISTDLEDPPQFVACAALDANRGRDMGYPESFAEPQRNAYPTLSSRVVPVEPELVVEHVRDALESIPGTEVIDVDVGPQGGRVEAVSVSRVFRFVDDVIVRIRAEGAGSRIDVRSKSRVGRGDMGANAARIEGFLLALH
jgi:hypothetical protein